MVIKGSLITPFKSIEWTFQIQIKYNVRDKQWKAAGVFWINLPWGGPEGNQTFPRGAAPRESLITQGTSRGQIGQTIPEAFPL